MPTIQSKFDQYVEACTYPGRLDPDKVEASLSVYLKALGVTRKIARLPQWWNLEHFPSIRRSVASLLKRLGISIPIQSAREAREALDARDARAAQDALDAREARAARAHALHRFAAWCIQSGSWWYWRWELSWIVTTYFGAVQKKKWQVKSWAEPLLEAYLHGAWILYWTDDTLFWVAKPTVHRDTSNTRRLHHSTYAALESDVENLYFWHGVLVPAYVVVQPEWITVTHIETESNAEIRRVMIERFGQWRYLQASGATLVGTDARGALYRKEIAGDEPLVMVKVKNSTPEPDGSFKDYFLRVPPNMKTAEQAVAWTFSMESKEYAPSIET